MPFYAIAVGKKTGVFETWAECSQYVKDVAGAVYRKFPTREEAEQFVKDHKPASIRVHSTLKVSRTSNTSKASNRSKTSKASKASKTSDVAHDSKISKKVDLYVYTDGSCINNGQANARAGIGIYFGPDDPRNVSKRVQGKQTNNTAELTAILNVFQIVKKEIESGMNVCIVSDSTYAIRCATTYGKKQEKEGWVTDIPNKELVKELYETYKPYKNVVFMHIDAHTGASDIHSKGNEEADRLANLAIGRDPESSTKPVRFYMDIPFIKKDAAKKLGARWDPGKKKWYATTLSMRDAILKVCNIK